MSLGRIVKRKKIQRTYTLKYFDWVRSKASVASLCTSGIVYATIFIAL